MGIWERLGSVIKSYINDDASKRDPDLDAAYEELDDFLWGKNSGEKARKQTKPVPEEIRKAFAELGLESDASPEECKEAYKKLLKAHHPDRHAKNQENMEKATDKTARLNTAYEKLEKWFLGKN